MAARETKLKRKAVAATESNGNDKSDDEEKHVDAFLNIGKDVSSDENESSDDEYTSDENEEFSFASDDEGNYNYTKEDSTLDEDKDSTEESEIDSDDIDDISESEDDISSDYSDKLEFNTDEEIDDDDRSEINKINEDKKQTSLIAKNNIKQKNYENDNNELEDSQIPSKSIAGLNKVLDSKNKPNKIIEEYENDTSDEEDIRNTVGNIPMHWYDEYKHIGYDWNGKKLIKPPKADQLDDFLKKMEDPDFWRTVKDPQTGQSVILSEEDIELIKRIQSQRVPNVQFNEYEPWIEWFTSEIEQMPIRNVPDHKRSFLPSKSEKLKVGRLVHALKMGWMKTKKQLNKERQKKSPHFYMLWETDTEREKMRRIHDHVAAPKRDLPGHAESYNPPAEYLFDEKEMKEWKKLEEEPHKRKLHFIPQKFGTLREVPAYSRYVRERFLRCLDLYLCPRARRMKLTIDAEHLIPKLPSPKDLQPFPTVESLAYEGHTDMIRSISIDPRGEFIVSGSDDGTIKIWEVQTTRCMKTIPTEEVIRSVAWCPNSKISLIAVASGQRLILLNPLVGDRLIVKKTDEILRTQPQTDQIENERIRTAVQWNVVENRSDYDLGFRIIISHFKPINHVTWHGRGDYFGTVLPEGANRSTLIHQLSKRRSQIPFSKSKGLIQCILFHPIKPCLFVATQRNVRIYDLVKQELVKKLLTNSQWISSMAIHPKGDNLLVSTYDKKMLWFDLDLSTKPYQTLRLHKGAVRNVAYHQRYPLFASASDDTTVIVSHGMVYNDLMQNPLIVPLKKLQSHKALEEFGVFNLIWHPMQPWIFSCGADATIRLFT